MIPKFPTATDIYNKFFMTTPQPYTEEEVNGLKFMEWDKEWTKNTAKKHSILYVEGILEYINIINSMFEEYAIPHGLEDEDWLLILEELKNK